MSLPAVTKHLDPSARADLIERAKSGPHGAVPPEGRSHGKRHAVARSLRTLLERTASIASPHSWRRSSAHQTKPHPQTPPQSAAGASLQRVDGPGKADLSDRPERDRCRLGPAPRWTCASGGRYRISFETEDGEHHEVGGVYREVALPGRLVFTWAGTRRPSASCSSPSPWPRTATAPCSPFTTTVLRRESTRRPPLRLDRHAGKARSLSLITVTGDPHGTNGNRSASQARGGTGTIVVGARRLPLERAARPRRERAKRFYRNTIGWTFQSMPTPDGQTYWLAMLGDRPVAGIYPIACARVRRHARSWMPYLAVDDVDKRVAKAVKGGAKLMKPIFDVPDVGRIAVLTRAGGRGHRLDDPVLQREVRARECGCKGPSAASSVAKPRAAGPRFLTSSQLTRRDVPKEHTR